MRSTASLRRAVRVSDDKLTYRFLLRPEARFHDGSRLTAKDVAFSLKILKTKGHPDLPPAPDPDGLGRSGIRRRPARAASRRSAAATCISSSPACRSSPSATGRARISRPRPSRRRSAPAPTRSAASSTDASSSSSACADYWGQDLPVNVGQNNFDRIPLRVFPRPHRGLRGLQERHAQLQRGIHLAHLGDRLRFPGHSRRPGEEGRDLERRCRPRSRAGTSTCAASTFKDPRIREAIGLAFDFEWTNANIMFGLFKRTTSYFENSDMKAVGQAFAGGSWRCSSRSAASFPPPSSASRPAARLRRLGPGPAPPAPRRRTSARGRLQARGRHPQAAEREAVPDRVPRFPALAAAAHPALPGQPEAARHRGLLAHRGCGPVPAPHGRIRFRHGEPQPRRLLRRPATACASSTARRPAKAPGSRNIAGIDDPAVDALIEQDRQRQVAPGAEHRLPCPGPGSPVGPLLGAHVVSGQRMARLLGPVLAPRDQAPPCLGRAGNLVVRCREGEADRERIRLGHTNDDGQGGGHAAPASAPRGLRSLRPGDTRLCLYRPLLVALCPPLPQPRPELCRL